MLLIAQVVAGPEAIRLQFAHCAIKIATVGLGQGSMKLMDLIRMFVESGGGVIMISSELSELSDLCHRVLIIKDGTIVRELKHDGISEQSILEALVG